MTRRRRTREVGRQYRPADADWAAWPGAAAYLRELRAHWGILRLGEPVDSFMDRIRGHG